MKKTVKIIIIALIVILAVGAAISVVAVKLHNDKYISKAEALEIALTDAQLAASDIIKADAEFEKTNYSAWYDIDIETHANEYEYHINAVSGAIESSGKEVND